MPSKLRHRIMIAFGSLVMVLASAYAEASCATWNPLEQPAAPAPRSLVARDLIELVNFGRPDSEPVIDDNPLGISPDGQFVATIVQRADLDSNGYCQALVLFALDGRSAPRVLDRGEGFLMTRLAVRGAYVSNGFARLNAARWSADGRWIAYLKQADGRVQLWRASPNGAAAMVTHAAADVERWAWSADGHSLAFAVSTGEAAAEAAIDAEGVGGWHYDERMAPNAGMRPQSPAPLPQAEYAIDPGSGTLTPVSNDDHRALNQDEDALDRHRLGANGIAVWAERASAAFRPLHVLRATDAHGRQLPCRVVMCTGKFLGLWWDRDGRRITILAATGWNHRFTALYRWTPGRDQPRLTMRTDDVVAGCRPAVNALICVREGAVRPPRLVAISPDDGHQRALFDPNTAFATFRLGQVRRLEWRNAIGHEVYGDLVLPPDYRSGRLPVIVTQYQSRGFLRGGTGSEYPIQLFALRGFAVLSIERPEYAATDDPKVHTMHDFSVAGTRGWAERRNLDSAISIGLDRLVAMGIADPARLGITGLSDGASAVRFALSQSNRFAAAAIASCCVDEASDELAGPAWERHTLSIGYPPAYPVDEAFWRPYSVSINAARMATPLLMQLADFEALMAVHAYTALRAHDQPTDLYVYPGEFHIRWQPRHRQATYERDLDWFSFWLQGHEDPAPAKIRQFAHWRDLRDRANAARTASQRSSSPP